MMQPVAQEPRTHATLTEGPDGLQIVIPVWQGRKIALGFFGAWFVLWNVGWLGMMTHLIPSEAAEVADGLQGVVIWVLGNAACVPMFLWYLAGKEVILVDDRALTIRRTLFGLGPTRRYDLARVRDLRACGEGLEVGSSVAFDHDGKRRRFGQNLPAAEVERLIEAIRGRVAIPYGRRTGPR